MYKFFLTTLCSAIILVMIPVGISAKPIFTKNSYLISSLSDNGNGIVSPGTGAFQLVYTTNRSKDNALDSDYWIIRNISGQQYTFQNSASGKYIRHDLTATNDRAALVLVNELQSDNSTSFTLEWKENGGISYYVIRSVVNTTRIWNRRLSLTSSVYPVGVYNGMGSSNEVFVFTDSEGNAAQDDGKVTVPIESDATLGVFGKYLQSFIIRGKTPVPDTSKKEYFVSLPEDGMPSTLLNLDIEYSSPDPAIRLYIDGQAVDSGTQAAFANVASSKFYTLELRKNTTTLETAKLYFTCLPIVQLFTDATTTSVYSLGRIAVTEPLKPGLTEVIPTKIRNRGGISIGYPKKNYAINLRDSAGIESADRSYFGLRNDNNWILDAMYVDPARMRNRVSTDLWNDFATKPYWSMYERNMLNGTRGQYVEVFLNDAYQGLYCMTEKIDRKQLDLKKLRESTDVTTQITTYTQRGASYKAVSWSTAVMFGYPFQGNTGIPAYNNKSISWSSFEAKYPDLDDGEPITWDNLYKAVRIASDYYTTDDAFKEQASQTFDLPVYLDYYLFVELMLATDNHGKNSYTNIYDQTLSTKVSITPWDLDGTWGIRWDGSKNMTFAAQDFDNFVRNNEHGQFNLFLRIKRTDTNNWSSYWLKERYKQLRRDHFSHKYLSERFRRYADLFIKSGASVRESARWGSRDYIVETNYISDWIQARLAYLDTKYLGGPYTSLEENELRLFAAPNPVTDWLYVSGVAPGSEVLLYNLQGILQHRIVADSEQTEVDMSSYIPGMYILKSGSSTIRIIKN